MRLEEKEEALFTEWKSRCNGFIKDGAVNPDLYQASALKILLVLKEVNDPSKADWDLREFVRSGARWQTWDNVTRWVQGIRRLDQEIPWSSLKDVTDEMRRDLPIPIWLKKIRWSRGAVRKRLIAP